jgi:hypothetical protein
MVNKIHLAGLAGSHTFQQDFTVGYSVSDKTGFFSCNYFVTGVDGKAVLSIPGDTCMVYMSLI